MLIPLKKVNGIIIGVINIKDLTFIGIDRTNGIINLVFSNESRFTMNDLTAEDIDNYIEYNPIIFKGHNPIPHT